MKKLFLVFAVIALAGCSGKPKLYLYNWAYYTPEDVVSLFEKEYNVRIVIDEYSSNEEMFAKLKAGGRGYDLIFPTQDYVSIMIKENMLERLDRSKMPNLRNIDPFLLQKAVYDPNMNYSVPYYWGIIGIIVNTDRVPDYEESWSIFGRSDLRGRMTLLDDKREVIGAALKTLGYSLNSRNPQEITEARDLINNHWRPNVVKFDSESFGTGYANGDFWVVHSYPNTVFEEIADNEQLQRSTKFIAPKEGASGFIDNMVIPKGAGNIDLAHQFIDFIHRPEIYAMFCDYFGFPSTVNIPAREFVQVPSWYQLEDILDAEITYDLEEALDLYEAVWSNSIRTGS